MKKLITLVAMLSLLVLTTGAALAATVLNGDFETLVPGISEADALAITPLGWVGTGGGAKWAATLTKEQVFAGKYAMLIQVDPENDPWGVHVSSKPIPVEAGKEYTISLKVLNMANQPPYTGAADLYVEFWPEGAWWKDVDYWSADAAIGKLKGVWAGGTRLGVVWTATTNAMNEWATVEKSGVAPENAKYMTIAMWTSRRVLRTFIDDVTVTVK